ncbi:MULTISPECIES: response regulator [Dactylosporangium]|uniref:DNA-binding response regulator n=2 Tax=Dactylosporangium TaxID=35753 RepID=A0A9W6KSN6_9ACTN|nr:MULTISPECIES: response regulator transcription factor [Dactylosporangium]UAC01031.1 response regulator transcription factor [Dactylosporangium vinaceum]UWZ48600.1 response regulator transcription factor [Dactylosporangium matsuzakiense]GLL06435.1 DNA-binding response regulator [Dactylosporangium matsuzakiense]
MTEPITVLVADDHPLFRKGLRALLHSMPGFEVVGEATDGAEAVRLAARLGPRLILLDLQMPGGDGLTAIRGLAALDPGPHILVVTMFADDDSVFAALRAGARGYVLKDTDDEEMIRAIHAVGRGEAIFSPAIATRIMAFFAGRPAEPFPGLTGSERSVLQLMARGLSNEAIAGRLGLSPKTVRNYVSNVFGKLHVVSRAEAIVRARDAGIG